MKNQSEKTNAEMDSCLMRPTSQAKLFQFKLKFVLNFLSQSIEIHALAYTQRHECVQVQWVNECGDDSQSVASICVYNFCQLVFCALRTTFVFISFYRQHQKFIQREQNVPTNQTAQSNPKLRNSIAAVVVAAVAKEPTIRNIIRQIQA